MSVSLVPPIVARALPALMAQAVAPLASAVSFLDQLRDAIANEEPLSATIETTDPLVSAGQPVDIEAAEFAQELRARLTAMGIDFSVPLRLKSDGRDVTVDGDHPDRVLVESLFAHDLQLAKRFHALVSAATHEHAASPHWSGGEFRLEIDRTSATITFE